MEILQTSGISEFFYEHSFFTFLLIFAGIPGFAAISTKVILTVLDLIVYSIFGKPKPVQKPAPVERPEEEKAMIRQVASHFMARRGVSPGYAVEQAEELVDTLKKKGLLK